MAHNLWIRRLNFHTHITFIYSANILTRRNKIEGLIAKKPISRTAKKAVEELVRLFHARTRTSIPESTLQVLMMQVSVPVNRLHGSVRYMTHLRKDLITVMVRKLPPEFFFTLSAADSVWIETYLNILKGASIQDVKTGQVSKTRNVVIEAVPVTVSFKNHPRGKISTKFHIMPLILSGKDVSRKIPIISCGQQILCHLYKIMMMKSLCFSKTKMITKKKHY